LIPVLNRHQINFIIGTFYSLSIGHLDFADPTMVLQTILLAKKVYFPLLLAGALPLIIALLFGRIFCGWICPFNAMAELVYWLQLKIRKKKYKRLSEVNNPRPHFFWIAFGIAVAIVMIFGIPFMSYISAPGIISSQIADWIFIGQTGFEILLIVLLLILEVTLFRRVWCKYVCPIGILISLFHYKHTMQVKFLPDKCTGNEKVSICNAVCQFGLNPKKDGIYPYCINCGDCVDICQKRYGKALQFTFHRRDEPCR
jgi:ferredoxin-type protein NapH